MDNHFVPNLTLGLPVVKRIAEVSPVPLDVHLMIEDADRWAPEYAAAGAASVTFHAEADAGTRPAGPRAAVARRPGGDRAAARLAGRAAARPAAGVRHDPGDDGRARLRRPVVHRGDAAQDPARPCRRSTRPAATPGSRSTAESRATPSAGSPQAGANVFVAGSAVYGAPDIARRDRRPARRWRTRTPDRRECPVWHDRWRSTNTQHVLRGRCNSEPAVTVRDPHGPQGSGG